MIHFLIRPYKNATPPQQEQTCGTRLSSAGKLSARKSVWLHTGFEVANTLTHLRSRWCIECGFSCDHCLSLLFLWPGSLYISLMISPGSHPCLISYPLKKTEIGRLTGENIIYLRLSSKSYKIPGFKLYTEKQSNTSTGNHPSLWVNRPLQTACSTYLTSKGCENRANAKIACCVPPGRMVISI